MTAEEFKTFSTALKDAPQPSPKAAQSTYAALPLRQHPLMPEPLPAPAPKPAPQPEPEPPQQMELPMPAVAPWRYVGELYRSYLIVEQGEDAFLIDKHAAHERILFEKLKKNQEAISAQALLQPVTCRLGPEACAVLLANRALLEELAFEVEDFGDGTLLARRIPMDLMPEDASDVLESMAQDLLRGRREENTTVRDELLHTVACKAAIKAGWKNDERELTTLIEQVMADESLKYCPHGRPICVSLSKKQLEKQFKRA